MDFLQFQSYLDVKGYSPEFVSEWENFMEYKETIDQTLYNIENQLVNFNDLGINYFINPSSITIDELKKYVIDKYVSFLQYINKYIAIIDIDNIVVLPEETVKVFKLVYSNFYAEGYDELYTILLSSNIEKHYVKNGFSYIKNVFILYFENIIMSLQKLRSLMKDKTSIEILNKNINQYYVLKQYIEASDEKYISDFAMCLIGECDKVV